jgi:hypothetical protein
MLLGCALLPQLPARTAVVLAAAVLLAVAGLASSRPEAPALVQPAATVAAAVAALRDD